DEVRSMGRSTYGVRGITLRDDDEVVSMDIVEEDMQILHVTNKGIGKRTPEKEYRTIRRGGKGVFTCRLTEDTGHVVSVMPVTGEEDIMLITAAGVLIRIPVETVSQTGRNTQGVRLIRLKDDEEVATIAKIDQEEIELEEEGEEATETEEQATERDEQEE